MILVVAKGVGIGSIMVIAAILNGLARDKLLTPLIGSAVSLPLSGITLSGLVFIISYFTIPFFGEVKPGVYFIIGLSWVVMTLAFEYLFGALNLITPRII